MLEELTGKPPRLSCALENSGEWSRCDLIFEPTRIGYRNPEGGACAGSTVWHSWVTTPAARVPRMVDGVAVPVEVSPAHTITPAEAVESLYARETPLWPWSPGDDAAPRWWCDRCDGTGNVTNVRLVEYHECLVCDGGTANDPPSLASFVAVASLGDLTLRYAEGHARTLVGRAPRVTFRVVSRETLRAWAEEPVYRDGNASLGYVMAHEAMGNPSVSPLNYGDGDSWPVSFRWLGLSGDHVARRHWSGVRDLGLLGVMLVALDGDRVTLAVEAL